jgi:hypothetical protein
LTRFLRGAERLFLPSDAANNERCVAVSGNSSSAVRGFMAGAMKKAGYTVESFKPEGGEHTYRINK